MAYAGAAQARLLFVYRLVSFRHALHRHRRLRGSVCHHPRPSSRSSHLIAAGVLGAVVAAPVAPSALRYVKIYFGMLTLAFGMLFYTFLLKFYRLTGGDEGMRVLAPAPRPDLGAMPKTDYLAGPTIILAGISPWRPSSCGASCTRPSAFASRASAIIPPRQRALSSASPPSLARLRHLGGTPRWPARSAPTGNRPTLAYGRGRQYRLRDAARGFELFGPVLRLRLHLPQDTVMSVVPYRARLRRHPRSW